MPTKAYPRERLKAIFVKDGKWATSPISTRSRSRTPTTTPPSCRCMELLVLLRDHLKQPGLVVTTLSQLEKLAEDTGNARVAQGRRGPARAVRADEALAGPDQSDPSPRGTHTDPAVKTNLNCRLGGCSWTSSTTRLRPSRASSGCSRPIVQRRGLANLKDLYSKRRDWEKMIMVQQRELQLLADPVERQTSCSRSHARPAPRSRSGDRDLAVERGARGRPDQRRGSRGARADAGAREGLGGAGRDARDLVRGHGRRDQARRLSCVKLGSCTRTSSRTTRPRSGPGRRCTAIDPENRRAQDALKKLYVTEGDMDCLETFYAKQDKWAEFVRVIEKEAETAEDARPAHHA